MKIKIKRFERKWIFKSNNYLALINALLRSNLFFRTQYPLRKVNSVYFDTYNYSSIRQNLDGVSYKKDKIRWYGNKNIMNNPLIEIKKGVLKHLRKVSKLMNLIKWNYLT